MKVKMKKKLPGHRQFNKAMMSAAKPILAKAVSSGELDILECGKIETQMNKSLNNPLFQMDQKHVKFIVGQIKKSQKNRRTL
jgi:hypothetical protein